MNIEVPYLGPKSHMSSPSLNYPFLYPGRITRVIEPTEEANRSGKWVEYDVEIARLSHSAQSRISVRCRLAQPIGGGIADYQHMRLRADKPAGSTQSGSETMVYVQFEQGGSDLGVIVGFQPNLKAVPDTSKAFESVTNGVMTSIASDGSFTVRYMGETDKDGNGNKSNTYYTMNHDYVLESDGRVKITAHAGDMTLKADTGKLYLDGSAGNQMGAGTNQHVLGTTYRAAEAAMLGTVAAAHAATAAAMGSIAAWLLDPANAATTAPTLQSTLPALLGAAAAAAIAEGAAVAAVTAFEAAGPSYLSLKNSLD